MAKLAGVVLSVLLLSVVGFLPYYADAQTQTKYLSYENKQYGFSIKYPSDWEKAELFGKNPFFPNTVSLVSFSSSNQEASYSIALRQDDSTYKGLDYQQFLDTMKKEFTNFCEEISKQGGGSCEIKFGDSDFAVNKKGYSMYFVTVSMTVSAQGQTFVLVSQVAYVLDGNDIWMITAGGLSEQFSQYNDVLREMGDSFTIFDYGKEQTTSTTSESIVPSSGYKIYKNDKYSFTLEYPSGWSINDIDEKFEYGVNIVRFDDDPKTSTSYIEVQKYRSASFGDVAEKKYLNEWAKWILSTTDLEKYEVLSSDIKTKNGFARYIATYDLKYNNYDEHDYSYASSIPVGGDLWVLYGQVSETMKDDLQKVIHSIDSFSSEDIFQLHAKARQKNNIVNIVFYSSDPESIYGIKLTAENSKITNFIKIKGWDHKRINENTVMYQTKYSPVDFEEMLKVKLKVDGKNTEIKWETFDYYQKSLGTGKVKT